MTEHSVRIGILGGTFDPVHNGHLHLAGACRSALSLTEVRLIPCAVPAHRPLPEATTTQRLAMLKLAVAAEPGIRVDDREILRGGVSYTIDTLCSLRDEYADACLCFVVGVDAFQEINRWRQWTLLLQQAHIIVINRPGQKTELENPQVADFFQAHRLADNHLLCVDPCGFIARIDLAMLDISATEIRRRIAAGMNVDSQLPAPVLAYVREHGLYQARR